MRRTALRAILRRNENRVFGEELITMTASQQIMNETEQYVLHTYNRFPVVFERGEGVHLYDAEGKEYLDFGAGIAVFALGYGNQAYNSALKGQIDRLIHTSNLFYHKPLRDAAQKVIGHTGLSRVFFTNSGAEAIEGAIKAARKYAYLRDGSDDHEIIAMNQSFHGRTIGALSVTGNAHYQDPFRPLMGGVKFADFNDFESVLSVVNDRTCAILIETIQGEGGIYPADPAFLQSVRKLCDEKDILLILDEIQCGMGRSGAWFACENYGVKPDIMTLAKALGCGIPVGAFVLNKKAAAQSLAAGDHGTTYGGNPLACAAVSAVFDLFDELKIVEHVRQVAPYLEKRLDELVQGHECLKERRGMGLMQGVAVEGRPASEIVKAAVESGLVILSAGNNVIRFVPPLIITKEDIDEMIGKLEAVLVNG